LCFSISTDAIYYRQKSGYAREYTNIYEKRFFLTNFLGVGNTTPIDNCKFKIKKQMSGGSHLFPFGGYPCEGILILYITFNAVEL
jgi:hypothetical protein